MQDECEPGSISLNIQDRERRAQNGAPTPRVSGKTCFQECFGRTRAVVQRIVQSVLFQVIVMMIIFANAIWLAIQQEWRLRNAYAPLEGRAQEAQSQDLDLVFAIWFLLEMGLRFFAEGKDFFFGPNQAWNIFDSLIVVEDQHGNLAADAILAFLSQAGGYEVDAFPVLASHYGLPQKRQRLYYVMISRQHLEPSDQAPLQPVGNALESLRSLVHDEPLDAEDTMKPGTGSATPVRTRTNGETVVTDGPVGSLLGMSSDATYLHRRLRHELRLPLDDLSYFEVAGTQLARWLRTYREADLCQIHWLRAKSHQRLGWISIPSLTPTTRLWSYRLQRVLGGLEMLKLQGFKPETWTLEPLSEASVCRVAGSAMTVHMIAALLASTLSCTRLPKATSSRCPAKSPSTVSLAELRSRYAAIRQRLSGLRRCAALGA
eukprot:g16906.t1